jgi:hypothetical protein
MLSWCSRTVHKRQSQGNSLFDALSNTAPRSGVLIGEMIAAVEYGETGVEVVVLLRTFGTVVVSMKLNSAFQ